MAGITSDANVLFSALRLLAQRYRYSYGECIPCEQLVSHLCDVKQAYTQYGGKRPFGVSILYIGWDNHYGYQLYQSDPSGNYSGWKATCIGNNYLSANLMLEQELSETEQISLEQAKDLAMKVLSKPLDTTKLTTEKLEMAILQRVNDRTEVKILNKQDVDKLIAKHNKKEAEAEATKKEKEAEQKLKK